MIIVDDKIQYVKTLIIITRFTFIIQQRSREHFNLLILVSCSFSNFNSFVTLGSTSLRPPEDDAAA